MIIHFKIPHTHWRLAAFIIIAAVSFVGVIYPAYNRLKIKLTDIEKAQATVQEQFQQTITLRQTRSALTTINNQKEAIEQLFIDPEQELALVTDLERKAATLGLTEILTLEEKTAGPTDTTQVRRFRLNLSGLLPSLLRFLVTLEFENPLVLVDSAQFLPAPDGASAVLLNLTAHVFIRPK